MSIFGNLNGDRLHRILIISMAVGVAVFAAAVYFMITGEYVSLLARQQHESLLNSVALGGLLFSAAAWYLDQFFRPIIQAPHEQSH